MPLMAEVTMLFGIKEQLIFPEIEYDKVDKVRGMDIICCNNSYRLTRKLVSYLRLFNMPFIANNIGGKFEKWLRLL